MAQDNRIYTFYDIDKNFAAALLEAFDKFCPLPWRYEQW